MKFRRLIFAIILCLTLTGCIHHPETPSGYIHSWLGEYMFYEFEQPPIGSPVFMEYTIIIYEESGIYFANLIIDGFQTMSRVKAFVEGCSESIDLIFAYYLEDNLHERFNAGDILLTLFREDGEVMTSWEGLQPVIIESENPGVHFKLQ